jgi:hypothetical protein
MMVVPGLANWRMNSLFEMMPPLRLISIDAPCQHVRPLDQRSGRL